MERIGNSLRISNTVHSEDVRVAYDIERAGELVMSLMQLTLHDQHLEEL